MLVKSIREDDHLNNLQETFNYLQSYNMKLNPNKCVFKVTVGKFLGFMEVQNLNGQGGTKPKQQGSCIKQVRLKSNR